MWIGGVRVIVFDENDRILMVRQHHEGRDIWMVPGGGIEEGENAAQAAVREVKEETCLDILVGRLIWHVEEVSPERGQRFVNFFLATKRGGNLELGRDPEFDDDHQVMREVRFMTREEVEELDNIYPQCLRDKLWEYLDMDCAGYDVYKERTKR